jgi:hypothetical protein
MISLNAHKEISGSPLDGPPRVKLMRTGETTGIFLNHVLATGVVVKNCRIKLGDSPLLLPPSGDFWSISDIMYSIPAPLDFYAKCH